MESEGDKQNSVRVADSDIVDGAKRTGIFFQEDSFVHIGDLAFASAH